MIVSNYYFLTYLITFGLVTYYILNFNKHFSTKRLNNFTRQIEIDDEFNRSNNSNDSLIEFKMIHKNIMMGLTKQIKVSVNSPFRNGYANKLYSMITSLVVALLTDSAFI